MLLTDTHTHIYYSAASKELDLQVRRCAENELGSLFLPNDDLKSIRLINRTVSTYHDSFFLLLGLHPCSVQEDFKSVLGEMESWLNKDTIYVIGEIGLDLYWDKSTLAFQQEAFKIQVQWAKDLNLPIVIHCRDAFPELFELLEELKDSKLRGIFHCFTGSLEQAKQAIDYGFYLGIGGVVTFKNAGLDNVVKEIDLQH